MCLELNFVQNNKAITLFDSMFLGENVEEIVRMFSYRFCDNLADEQVKKCRGAVFLKDKFICSSFKYTPEYNCDIDKEYLTALITPNIQDIKITPAYEGTLIRLFCIKNQWFISTNKKLNAFESRWSCNKSFGELFEDFLLYKMSIDADFKEKIEHSPTESPNLWQKFANLLNPERQHIFMILNNNQNRIVCQASNVPSCLSLDSDFTGINPPEKLWFNTIDDIFNYVEDLDINEKQGIFVKFADGNHIKILNNEYSKLYKIRANSPDIFLRYIELRQKNSQEFTDFKHLYKEYTQEFNQMEETFQNKAQHILSSYIKRYIKREFIRISQEEFFVLITCHKWHIENRDLHKININKVKEVMNLQKPKNLLNILRGITTYKHNTK